MNVPKTAQDCLNLALYARRAIDMIEAWRYAGPGLDPLIDGRVGVSCGIANDTLGMIVDDLQGTVVEQALEEGARRTDSDVGDRSRVPVG